jgi:hypothetical protein
MSVMEEGEPDLGPHASFSYHNFILRLFSFCSSLEAETLSHVHLDPPPMDLRGPQDQQPLLEEEPLVVYAAESVTSVAANAHNTTA